jgi:hypothetical protein
MSLTLTPVRSGLWGEPAPCDLCSQAAEQDELRSNWLDRRRRGQCYVLPDGSCAVAWPCAHSRLGADMIVEHATSQSRSRSVAAEGAGHALYGEANEAPASVSL